MPGQSRSFTMVAFFPAPTPTPSPSAWKSGPLPHLLICTPGLTHPLSTSDLPNQRTDAFPFPSLHLQPLLALCSSLCPPDQESPY